MKRLFRIFCLGCLFLVFIFNSYAQWEGKVLESKEMMSNVLNKLVRYSVYLPKDYETSERNYPVVYLLHGLGGNFTSWIQVGEIKRYTDKAIADGTIPPMVIIMPDGERTWFLNSYDGKILYEDFFFKEFMPAVEKTYRIRAEKKYRGIAGLSMGGYGALYYAFQHPELFTAAAPLSAAVRTDSSIIKLSDAEYEERFVNIFSKGSTGNRLTASWYAHSILEIVKNKPAAELSKVNYWIDCGDDDYLTEGNCLLHLALLNKKVPHEFRVRDGAHDWTYWRTGIVDALHFVGENFR